MNNQNKTSISAEESFAREHRVSSYACRQLAEWALAHFGDRTDPTAYQRIVMSLGLSGADIVVEKVHKDLCTQSFNYRPEAVMRMYDRFRMEGERRFVETQDVAA